MEISNATLLAYLNAGIVSTIMAFIFVVRLRCRSIHSTFVIAAGIQAAWLYAFAFCFKSQAIDLAVLNLLESLHFSAWIFAIYKALTLYCERRLPPAYSIPIALVSVGVITLNVFNILSPDHPLIAPEHITAWQGLFFSVIGLFNAEQLYRNTLRERLLKLMSLNLAILFIFNIFFFTQSFISEQVSMMFIQLRAIVALVTGFFIALNVIIFTHGDEIETQAKLSLSRPIVFYTTSLTIAGSLLTTIGLGGYYIRLYGGDWGEIIYSVLLVSVIITLVVVFTSEALRDKLTVLINKHLFSHKYDYRAEWLKLIDELSKFSGQHAEDIYKKAITVVTDIFKCHGGVLWLKRGQFFVPVYQHNVDANVSEYVETTDCHFCKALESSEWVFFPSPSIAKQSLKQHNEHLPEWTNELPRLWLIMPLLIEADLQGFIALTSSETDSRLNWEDLDLLKTVGRQIASYLKRHEQAEMLAESAQFDTFNKLAAYVMHDLKNIIAQQSLVVKNAEKHKDNPAFVEDAMSTINNSVGRMNTLLRKLQRNESEEVRTLSLTDILIESVQRCNKSVPAPTLRKDERVDIKIKADWDNLVMVFVHIIQNAQDATDANGYVDVDLNIEDNVAMIHIEDNGQGMDDTFIRERLFKPFETTKSGKGMGIGVYQASDYIQSLGGSMKVDSQLGDGTSFTITLPYLDVEINE